MHDWELEFPLSKMSGDYSLAEAEYFTTIGGYRRALRVLQAYRQGVDMSPFLADSMSLELECLLQLGKDADARSIGEIIVKRFPGHPAAEKARNLSATLGPATSGKGTEGAAETKVESQ